MTLPLFSFFPLMFLFHVSYQDLSVSLYSVFWGFFFFPHTLLYGTFPWPDPEKTSLDFTPFSSDLSFYCCFFLFFFISFPVGLYMLGLFWPFSPSLMCAVSFSDSSRGHTVLMRSSYEDIYFVPVQTIQTGAQLKWTLISCTRLYSKMLTANLRYTKF